ncbi:rubrerythrin family protein [Haloarcula salinisoli]|uniref:Rubrerythrin family protein n=1 Tax=Haloarcula salinisoli TaxID=2487746 RepID=A0A8J8CC85_9EURY|nr:rubrerythrin family protein [Halomicroarcula salinisoli]MBX0288089.1 rubrerythrin family protein [Halomicroarcula salinisoli]MBX0305218.1 rubrerythrin family protein [Halomicroarcula salinisoli]
MTADDLIDAVRDDQQTELSRLGSSKTLYADTRGEMEPDAIHAAAAAREAAAAATFEAWADDAADAAGALFADAASDASERQGETEPADREFHMHETLDALDATIERLGGLVGWTLVDKKVKEQLTGFFTGQADPQTASNYRSAGSEVEELRAEAADLLEETCEGDEDWAAAEGAAIDVVAAAYDDYVETLEDLGVNPKDVC